MSRVLPAHVLVAALALGLCLSNAARFPERSLAFGGAAIVVAGPLGSRRVWLVAAVVLLAGWWWGSVRLDSLDHSVLAPRIGTAGDLVAVTTAEARPGAFIERQFARATSFDGHKLDERVELELPLGRSPPQGAALALLAVVEAPKGPEHGFDERTWLRRQGVHVVLHVDRWRVIGRRGGLGGVSDRIRGWLRHASSPGLHGERRALVEGVLLGDDTGLSDNLKQAFRRSGLYHLLAVSGQNVVLLATGVLGLAVLLGVGRAWGHVATLAAIGA